MERCDQTMKELSDADSFSYRISQALLNLRKAELILDQTNLLSSKLENDFRSIKNNLKSIQEERYAYNTQCYCEGR